MLSPFHLESARSQTANSKTPRLLLPADIEGAVSRFRAQPAEGGVTRLREGRQLFIENLPDSVYKGSMGRPPSYQTALEEHLGLCKEMESQTRQISGAYRPPFSLPSP